MEVEMEEEQEEEEEEEEEDEETQFEMSGKAASISEAIRADSCLTNSN
jgi:hypothetical protein